MNLRSQRGVAIVMAIACALAVSLTAIAVMNLTSRRLFLSAFRTDHLKAHAAAEAGVKYAFSRMDKDAAFRDAIRNKKQGGINVPYVITSAPANVQARVEIRCGDAEREETPDERVNDLFMGRLDPTNPNPDLRRVGKEVTIAILFDPVTGRYRVCGSADYGS